MKKILLSLVFLTSIGSFSFGKTSEKILDVRNSMQSITVIEQSDFKCVIEVLTANYQYVRVRASTCEEAWEKVQAILEE